MIRPVFHSSGRSLSSASRTRLPTLNSGPSVNHFFSYLKRYEVIPFPNFPEILDHIL